MLKRRRGVSTLIGVAFFLLIFMTGFAYYALMLQAGQRYDVVVQEMSEFDRRTLSEFVTITSVTRTLLNEINVTVRNDGASAVHLVLLGVHNDANNTQEYFDIDFYVKPAETLSDIRNTTIKVYDDQQLEIRLITEQGNVISATYARAPDVHVSYYGHASVDENPPSAKGSHSYYSAQQGGPDGILDMLTEENTATTTQNVSLIDQESFEGAWLPAGWSEDPAGNNWNRESQQSYDGSYSADFDGFLFPASGNLQTPVLDASGAFAIYIDFWYMDDDLDAGEFLLEYYNGVGWNQIADLGSTANEDQWLNYVAKVTDSQYFVSDFRVRWAAVSVGNGEHAYTDLVNVVMETAASQFELDLEVKWTDVDFDEDNEWLCIYAGNQGAENLVVDVWDGGGWVTVIGDVVSGWNNVDVSLYLTSPTFYIRFRDEVPVSDGVEDSWEIDVVFLQVWTYTPP